MQALITGGFGFIGKHLDRTLIRAGIESYPFGTINTDLIQETPYSFFDEFDTIFHLAAIPRVGVSLERPGEVLVNNYQSTLHLLEYCKQRPEVKLIFASSSSAHFADLKKNPYALSKLQGEQLVSLYRESFGVRATSVRFFNVYGPREADYGKHTTLIKAFKTAVRAGNNLNVNGDGSIGRDYTHVNDVVSGLLRVALEMIRGDDKELYEIGAGRIVTVLEIAKAFQEGTELEIVHGAAREGDAPFTQANPSLLPVGWYQTIDVLDHIKDWKNRGCPED